MAAQAEDWTTIDLAWADDGQIATVTLNRPEALNAISRQLAAELRQVCQVLGSAVDLRAVVVTGAGERGFCAGADLRERKALSATERTAHTAEIEAAAEELAALPVPAIAALRGYTLAGGAELAIACDLRVAGADTEIGFPEVRVGIFPGAGGVLRLPRLVGDGAARDLLFTGRRIDAAEALRMGLVDRVVEPEQSLAVAQELAATIARNAPLAVRAVKRGLAEIHGRPHEDARRLVNDLRAALDATADYAEGLAAFAERREPRFSGR